MAKDNTNDNRISVVEDEKTKGLKSDLQTIADNQDRSLSWIIKKALSDFVKKYKAQ